MVRLKPIKNKNPFPTRAAWIRAIQAGLNETAKEGIRLLARTVNTWEDPKPQFKIQIGSNQYVVSIGTDNKLWAMLNEGTEPHIIRPRKAKRLAFQTGGLPKTFPRQLISSTGGQGYHWTFATEVHHPGTKAREWTQTAAKKLRPQLKRDMNAAIKQALRSAK